MLWNELGLHANNTVGAATSRASLLPTKLGPGQRPVRDAAPLGSWIKIFWFPDVHATQAGVTIDAAIRRLAVGVIDQRLQQS